MLAPGKFVKAFCIAILMFSFSWDDSAYAQNQYRVKEDNESNYGNTPSEIFPYSRFQEPYKRHFTYPSQKYLGPAREKAVPENLKEVRIGFLGPLHGSNLVDFGSQMLQGTQLALEDANARGGYNGLPYTLMLHNDVGLWGAAANEVVKMDDEKVWVILGTIDDNNTHIALRVALKLEIPMVNTGDPDPTLTETNIPWLVRCISDDRQSSYALCTYMYQVKNYKRVSILRTNSRYGRVGTTEVKATSERMGNPVILELRYTDGETDFTNQLEVIKKSSSDAVVLWGNPKELGMIVKQMRAMDINIPVLGCDRMINPEFIEYAGKENAEGIVMTSPYLPDMNNPLYAEFNKKYKERYNMDPDMFAVHAYDGMNMIIKSIEIAGLNRAKIRDVLLDSDVFEGYKGASGEMFFDATWNDVGEIFMAEIKNGEFKYFKRPEYKSGEASIVTGSQN